MMNFGEGDAKIVGILAGLPVPGCVLLPHERSLNCVYFQHDSDVFRENWPSDAGIVVLLMGSRFRGHFVRRAGQEV